MKKTGKRAFPCLLVAGLLAAAGPANAQQPGKPAVTPVVPARYFARFPAYDTVRLSPDGKHLAAVARVGGKFTLFVMQLPAKKVVSGLRLDGDAAVSDVVWASNQRLLVAMAHQEGAEDAPAPTGELFGMNVDGSRQEYLYGFRGAHTVGSRIKIKGQAEFGVATIVDGLPEDADHALVMISDATEQNINTIFLTNTYPALYRIDLLTGKRKPIAEAPLRRVTDYFIDGSGQARMVWGSGEEEYRDRTYWRSGDAPWELVPMPQDGLRPLRVTRDGRRAYFLASRPANQQCLVELGLPGGGAAATQPKDLLCRPAAELNTVFFTVDDRPYGYGGAAMTLIDPEPLEARVTASLQAQFPDQIVRLADSSHDHKKLLFLVYSDRNSGEYYLYDANTKEASFFDAVQTWLDPQQMATVQRIAYQARDGLDIRGYLTLPPGREPKQLPMVVLPHGGPIGVHDRWGWDADAQFLANRGYAVLQMNYRGSGGYGKEFEDRGYGEWGGKMIDDITDGARWAVAQGIADSRRLCIFGTSYGGYAALMSAVREPDLYRCAVGNAGVYDINLLMKDSDVVKAVSGRRFWEDSIAKTPEQRARLSPINSVDKLKAAVMIVHGERDIRSPISQAQALRKAMDARNLPYEWLVEEEEGHGFFNEDRRSNLYARLEAFLAKHLAVRTAPAAATAPAR